MSCLCADNFFKPVARTDSSGMTAVSADTPTAVPVSSDTPTAVLTTEKEPDVVSVANSGDSKESTVGQRVMDKLSF